MKSKEPGTIRQLFAFVGENNGKMLLSIFLAVLGELFGMGPFLGGLQRPRWYCFSAEAPQFARS